MSAPIRLRDDYDGATLRTLAKRSRDAGQSRRLLSLAVIYDGGTRSEAARQGAVSLQAVRDWVLRFNAGGPERLIDPRRSGRRPRLNDVQRQALADAVEAGPMPAVDGVVRWRLVDLKQWLWDSFAIRLSVQSVSRELRALGYRKLSARPRHHAQDPEAIGVFKKVPRCFDGDLQPASSGQAIGNLVPG